MGDQEREYDLSRFEEFFDAVASVAPGLSPGRWAAPVNANGYYCVKCAGKRRMSIQRLYWDTPYGGTVAGALVDRTTGFVGPGLFTMTCIQCRTKHVVVVHEGPDGFELAIFSAERGGFSTPNTPDSVAHYLDQAHRSESVGAMTAAAGMYRSALETLLYEQKYKTGMLDAKIKALLADAKPPAWRDQVDPEYLEALKQIGNGAVHPNDGNIERQQAIDRESLGLLRAVFEELLDRVYERPAVEAARKAKLTSLAQSFKKPTTTT